MTPVPFRSILIYQDRISGRVYSPLGPRRVVRKRRALRLQPIETIGVAAVAVAAAVKITAAAAIIAVAAAAAAVAVAVAAAVTVQLYLLSLL
jgi:hypothetical protein